MYGSSLRIESFGGTLFDLSSGKRIYLNQDETTRIQTQAIMLDEHIFNPPFNIVKPKTLPTIGFSFADTAFIELTRRCNLRCKHCLNNSGKELGELLSDDEIKKLIINLSKAGLQEIRFTGGEPLLHKSIFDFIKLCTDCGMRASIGTNGTLVSKEIASQLKSVGLKYAVVSIDGTESAHDNIRGSGNYKKAFDGIKNLQDVGIRIRINSVLMKNNTADIIELMKELNSKHIYAFIRRFIESGRGDGQHTEVLSKEDYDNVRKQLENELKDKFIKGHYLNDEPVSPRIELPFERYSCSAGQRGLVILPNGNIHTCGFLAAQGETPLMNVKNIVDWSEFWNNMIKLNPLKKLREELKVYNQNPNVQPTNCLAYVSYKLKE